MDFDKGTDLYKILGCDELATKEQINAEFKHRVRQVHPDKRPNDPTAKEKYDELKWAYDVLYNEESRKDYDTWMRSGIAIPFKAWLALKNVAHTAQHWALRPKKEKMLTDSSFQVGAGESVSMKEGNKISSIKSVESNEEKSHDDMNKNNNKRKIEAEDKDKVQLRWSDFTFGRWRRKFRKYEL